MRKLLDIWISEWLKTHSAEVRLLFWLWIVVWGARIIQDVMNAFAGRG